jgi:hypothetical protein
MASEQDVKQYLAYWFQLGKGVVMPGEREVVLPSSVLCGNRYSPEFEALWQHLRSRPLGESYLQGTHQTIAELLDVRWEISPCARCSMLVPMPYVGIPTVECPCADMPTWPNTELPMPRLPMNDYERLGTIRDRLRQPVEVES